MSDFALFGYPWERIALTALAIVRAWMTVLFFLLCWSAFRRASWPRLVIVLLLVAAIPFGAFLWADGVEHLLKTLVFGTSYNPYMMAIGEWEGWTGPTSDEDLSFWNAQKRRRQPPQTPWWGDVTCFYDDKTLCLP